MIDKQKIRQILDDNSNDSGDNCREFTRAEIDKTIEDIYNLVSVPAETLVMPKIAEAFERYLRSESEYPSINWSEKTVEEYRSDRRYRKDVYEEMKWQNHFSYAFEFAKKRLFDKIIKETLDSNFTA
jgi:DNA repair photolyase